MRDSPCDNRRQSPGEQGAQFEMEAARASAFLRTDPAARILIVEDDPELAADLDALFRRYGFDTEVVRSRTAALRRAGSADLVVLDTALPDGDGLEIWAALELGADDYMTKPFGSRELVARCRSVLRRRRSAPPGGVVQVGGLEVDIERYEARLDQRLLDLTTKELALLVALARRIGDLVRREQLAEEVWGAGVWSVNRSLDVHMSSLRRKLGDSPHHPRYIQTVHGLGFRLLPPVSGR